MSIINNQQKNKIKLTPDIDFVKAAEDTKPELLWNLEELIDKEWWELILFCKDCKNTPEKVEITKKKWKKKWYYCWTCWNNRVVRWTQKSLSSYFKQ